MNKPMFEQIADEIAAAVVAVVEAHRADSKRRKCSPNLLWYWVLEGVRRGASLAAKAGKASLHPLVVCSRCGCSVHCEGCPHAGPKRARHGSIYACPARLDAHYITHNKEKTGKREVAS